MRKAKLTALFGLLLFSLVTASASAAPGTYRLEVQTSGNGRVDVENSLGCPGSCAADYPAGQVVELIAKPGVFSTFLGWSGDCAGSGLRCLLTIDDDSQVTALFSTPVMPAAPDEPSSSSAPPASSTSAPAESSSSAATVPAKTKALKHRKHKKQAHKKHHRARHSKSKR